jgi:hypothetical protein
MTSHVLEINRKGALQELAHAGRNFYYWPGALAGTPLARNSHASGRAVVKEVHGGRSKRSVCEGQAPWESPSQGRGFCCARVGLPFAHVPVRGGRTAASIGKADEERGAVKGRQAEDNKRPISRGRGSGPVGEYLGVLERRRCVGAPPPEAFQLWQNSRAPRALSEPIEVCVQHLVWLASKGLLAQ